MHTDAFFTMGKTHTVCQDYAVAGETREGLAYAIVADGCSSSPRTDFGARFLATVAQRQIHKEEATPNGLVLAHQADAVRKLLDLPQSCLDATLLMAVWPQDGDLEITMHGDGAVAVLYDIGVLWWTLSFDKGAPAYLTYELNRDRKEVYTRESDNAARKRHMRTPERDYVICHHGDYDSLHGSMSGTYPGNAKGVVLFSDGVESFQNFGNGLVAVDPQEVVDEVLAFKGLKGEFLTRRCKKFLSKFCAANGWQHADDFSCAAIMRPQDV